MLIANISIAPCKKKRVSVRSPIVSPMPLTDRFATACVSSRACRDRGPCKPCRDSRVGVFGCRDRGRVSRVGVFACRSCFSWWKLSLCFHCWPSFCTGCLGPCRPCLSCLPCWPCRVGRAVSGQPCRDSRVVSCNGACSSPVRFVGGQPPCLKHIVSSRGNAESKMHLCT